MYKKWYKSCLIDEIIFILNKDNDCKDYKEIWE